MTVSPSHAASQGGWTTDAGTGAVLLEVSGRTAGILARAGSEFVFFASGRRFAALDRRSFRSPGQAERALQDVLRGRAVA